jgi:DNA repair protein RadB
MSKVSTGAAFFNEFLNGGYDNDIITTIYGPAGSGKTNLCLLAAVKIAEQGKNVLFIDTEGGIAVERIQQITPHHQMVMDNIMFCSPMTFTEQKEVFENLKSQITEHVGMIVVDSISMLYRLELGRSDNDSVFEVNSALGKQIASLVEVARKNKIPVLVTNQVYADFNNKDKVKMVGGDLLKYGSKCLIELYKFEKCRGMTLRKHRSMAEGKEMKFNVVEDGIAKVEEESPLPPKLL